MRPPRQFKIGDHVAYSVQWLRSTGQIAGDAGHLRGKIGHFWCGHPDFAFVMWNGFPFGQLVHVANLAIVGPNPRFCQC